MNGKENGGKVGGGEKEINISGSAERLCRDYLSFSLSKLFSLCKIPLPKDAGLQPVGENSSFASSASPVFQKVRTNTILGFSPL